MKKATILVLGLCLTVSLPLLAEGLEEGTWGGSMTIPGESEVEVRYQVAGRGDGMRITIDSGRNQVAVHSLRLTEETLSFSWGSEPTTDCTLELRDDGAYEGECVRDGGEPGTVRMVPPSGGDGGEDA